jgi:uncharacterized protein YndB with AHSA1/START domain
MADDDADIVLIVRRTIRAPVERVFAAWTQAEHLQRWWGPAGMHCSLAEIDLRVGGRYRIGNEAPNGEVVWIEGEFERIDAPHELVYSWRIGESAPERVTVRFESREGATEVVVVHERIANAERRTRHEAGWNGCIDGLVDYVERGISRAAGT